MRLSVHITDFDWLKPSNTLYTTFTRLRLSPLEAYPLTIVVRGKHAELQFFFASEYRFYKYDRLVERYDAKWIPPPGTSDIKLILDKS